MKLIISGFPPETGEDEIREALEKYGVPVDSVSIEPGNSADRYVALVDVDTDEIGVKVLTDKINGSVWNGKQLRAERFVFLT